jgi:hypothetical protein
LTSIPTPSKDSLFPDGEIAIIPDLRLDCKARFRLPRPILPVFPVDHTQPEAETLHVLQGRATDLGRLRTLPAAVRVSVVVLYDAPVNRLAEGQRPVARGKTAGWERRSWP